jgi:hypothetical protein
MKAGWSWFIDFRGFPGLKIETWGTRVYQGRWLLDQEAFKRHGG